MVMQERERPAARPPHARDGEATGQGEARERVPAIAAVDVRKSFGHVEALRGATLAVHPGEVVALVGDNGAGKSTLMKILCGALAPDEGRIEYGGEPAAEHSVKAAARSGLGVVYQDLALAPDLSVSANMHLGHLPPRRGPLGALGFLDRRRMRTETRAALEDLGAALPSLDVPVADLSGGQRQAVAIARAVKWAKSAVLLDEPTAALGVRQTEQVCRLIRAVADRGLAVLLISHDMPRVLEVADRVVVLRLGAVAADVAARETSIPDIVGAMLGAGHAETAR